jgi:LacI family transcriptional regulator
MGTLLFFLLDGYTKRLFGSEVRCMKRSTIKDIAQKVSVSITTVSLVLNNKPTRVSTVTKEKIFKAAKELNYTPNTHAKSLVTNRTNTIGLVIPDIENAFFSSISKAVEDISLEHDYMVLLVNSNDSHERSMQVTKMLIDRGVDGLLVVTANETYQENKQKEFQDLLKSINIPLVLVDRVIEGFNVNSVTFDGELGGYLATKHLIDHGNRNIACITGPKYSRSTINRLNGYKRALIEHGIEVNETYIKEGDFHFDSGYGKTNDILNTDATSIFAFNDLMAYGALANLTEKQRESEFTIVGYDNIKLISMNETKIDSVKQDSVLLSKEVCRILYNEIRSKTKMEIEQVSLKPQLIIR